MEGDRQDILIILQSMESERSRGCTKIELMEKYVKNADKNVFLCMHPSDTLHYYHTHDFFEINYVYEGSCINQIEGKSLKMTKGDMLFIHPGTFHTVYAHDSSRVVNVLIRTPFFIKNFGNIDARDSSLKLFFRKAGNKSYYKYLMCKEKEVFDIIAKLVEEEHEGATNAAIMQEALLSAMICRLSRESGGMVLSDVRGVSSSSMVDILQYVYENYASVTLSELSEKFSYSRAHISRMFTQQTGKSFTGTLLEIRMDYARTYLIETDKKIGEIARLLGYESVEYFQRAFKLYFGVSPMVFRTKSRQGFLLEPGAKAHI